MATKGKLAMPMVLLAVGGLLLSSTGCDIEEFFDDLEDIEIEIVNPWGGGYDCRSCGCGGCWDDDYYYEEEVYWWDWWW